jgi:hypothetical protein
LGQRPGGNDQSLPCHSEINYGSFMYGSTVKSSILSIIDLVQHIGLCVATDTLHTNYLANL